MADLDSESDLAPAAADEAEAVAEPDATGEATEPDTDLDSALDPDHDTDPEPAEDVVPLPASAHLAVDPATQRQLDTIRDKVAGGGAAVIPTLPRRKRFKHRLVPRERVSQLAARYGVDVALLREWNGLSPQTEKMRMGARVEVRTARIPPHRERIEYTVVQGDTWWSVGLRHGVDARDVRAYNYPSRGKMSPGSTLQIWIDPIVYDWVERGGDPMPDDDAFALRRAGVGIGTPDAGRLVNGVRIPKGSGYRLRLPKSAYGTSHAVAQILMALTIFEAVSEYAPQLEIGAMSRPRGGELKGHKSHQSGRDLDIRLPRRAAVPRYKPLTFRRVDWMATWQLIHALVQQDVTAIFLDYGAQRQLYRHAKAGGVDPELLERLLQYPKGRSAGGIVRHSPGHEQHLHVRVGCGPYETECVQ